MTGPVDRFTLLRMATSITVFRSAVNSALTYLQGNYEKPFPDQAVQILLPAIDTLGYSGRPQDFSQDMLNKPITVLLTAIPTVVSNLGLGLIFYPSQWVSQYSQWVFQYLSGNIDHPIDQNTVDAIDSLPPSTAATLIQQQFLSDSGFRDALRDRPYSALLTLMLAIVNHYAP